MKDSYSDDYFVDGGTLRANTPSYVTRLADEELFDALLAREYCYVLTPRQMGKSSLMIRTSQRLREHNIKSAIVDIQRIGTDQIKEWYGSLLSQIRRGLRLTVDVDEWMKQESNIGYGELFVHFIQDVVLTEILEPVVIFVDEVDWMIKIKFRDDFFASIRAIYNARAQYPELERVSFVLLGVASPADLIAEPTRTPFNIGHAIHLQELSLEDADPLQNGLESVYPGKGKRILDHVFYWTNGHPYLTQKLCKSIVESREPDCSNEAIDRLVYQLFLSDRSRNEANIKLVQERILSFDQKFELLDAYKRILRSKQKEDRQSPLHKQLMLSGVVNVKDGYLVVRNRIYMAAFNKKWVDENLRRDWRRITIVVLGSLLAVFIATLVIIYNLDTINENKINEYTRDFLFAYNNNSSEGQVANLANIFRTKGILRDLGQDSIARALFFSQLKSRKEQTALFINYRDFEEAASTSIRGNPQLQEDLVVVIRGIYYSLALTAPRNNNTDLLHAMQNSLRYIPAELSSSLDEEIGNWVTAREFVYTAREFANDDDPLNDEEIEINYSNALDSYGAAIDTNPANPALYFERALLYLSLRDPLGDNALKDLDKVISIIGISTSQNPNTSPQPSGTILITTNASTAIRNTSAATESTPNSAAVPIQGAVSPAAARTATRRPEALVITQTALTTQPTDRPTSVPRTATPTPAPIFTPTITFTATPEKFTPGFYKEGRVVYFDIRAEVEHVLQQNTWLGDILATSSEKYPNLEGAGLAIVYSTLTPTSIPTPTPTPTLIVPALTNLETISEANAISVTLLGKLGKGPIRDAVYSPDGTVLAVASSLGIYFYDSTSLNQLGFIETVDGVNHLAFSPNGQIIASSLENTNTIYLWNATNRAQVGKVLTKHSGSILSLAFASDELLASGSEDTTVIIWRIRDGEPIQTIEHPDIVRSVTFSPTGDLLASASDNNMIWLWNVPEVEKVSTEEPTPLRTLDTFGGSQLAFSPDGQTLAAGSDDDVLRLWRVSDGQLLNFTAGAGTDIAFSPDGNTLAAVSLNSEAIQLLGTGNNNLEIIESFTGDSSTILNVSFSPDGKKLLSSSVDNTIQVWDVGSGNLLETLDDHVISPYVAISPNGQLLASGAEDGSIHVWRLSEGRIIQTMDEHTGAIRSLAFNHNGDILASGSDDGTVRLWSVSDGNLLHTLRGHTGNVFTVAFRPDGQVLVSGSADGDIRFWSADGQALQTIDSLSNTVNGIAFASDGLPIAAALGDPHNILLMDVDGSFYFYTVLGFTDAFRSLDFSPDGDYLVVGSDDTTVGLWSIDGSLLQIFRGHTDIVRSVAFSSDGSVIASASYDGTVRLWSVNTGSLIKTLTGHRAEVYSLAFSSDGKFFVTGSPDGTISIWGLSP